MSWEDFFAAQTNRESPEKGSGVHLTEDGKDEESSLNLLTSYSKISESLKPELRESAKRIAARTAVRIAAREIGKGLCTGFMESKPYSFNSYEEIDLEKTVENMLGKPFLDYEDIYIFKRTRRYTPAVLLVDCSLSMFGFKIAAASLAAASLSLCLKKYSVIGFNHNAWIIASIDKEESPVKVCEKIFDVPAGGFTNIAEALELGVHELSKESPLEKVGILITDGEVTAGKNPFPYVCLYDHLHVLGLPSAQNWICSKLAKLGNGRFQLITNLDQVCNAIKNLLS